MTVPIESSHRQRVSCYQVLRAWKLALCMTLLVLVGCHAKDRLPATGTKEYADYSSSFYTGLAGLQVGDDVRADGSLSQATTLVPGEPAAWADWGILAFRQRNFDNASQRIQRALTLAPQDGRIEYLLGLVDSARGDSASAIADFQKSIANDPRNLRALYRLATEVERQGGPDSDAQVQKLMEQLLQAQPGNLAALVDLCRIAAKRGDTATLHSAISRLAQQSQGWPTEAREQFGQLQAAASSAAPRAAATRSTFLRNVLMRQPEFRDSLSEIAAAPGEEAEPITHFVRLENLPSVASPADTAMTFTSEPVPASSADAAWGWIGAIALNGDDAPVIAEADGHHVHLASGADVPFPGGPSAKPPAPEGVVGLDYNYDFKTDLLLAGAGGLRLFRQENAGSFSDVTAAMKLSASVTSASYSGAWAVDIEADGDLDVVLGAERGLPTVLQNNADGTFTVIHPFAGISGIRQFAWADLNGDGNPDAALIDGGGKLHIFLNQRNGRFDEAKRGEEISGALGVTIADTGRDGFLRVHVLRSDGSLIAISWQEKTSNWSEQTIAQLAHPPSGEVRLRAADMDNNGAIDLIVMQVAGASNSTGGAVILLQDASGTFQAMNKPQGPPLVFGVADVHNDGRLDLLGVTADGKGEDARSVGTKQYRWQTIRPRARQATGDQRINPFGIGGDIEIRSGLLLQKQPIDSPALHFGLGDRQVVDVARIVWPNGTVRAEFNLKSNQQIVTEQRLKGSCPFLFAWDGTRMNFVKDSVPWGSAIGLRINSLGTAKISATEEWYKISADQLKPRDGYYDLRVTGELWETYYYDSLALMTVDHPAGTEIFTDERFDVPAVKLAVTAVSEPQPIKSAVDDRGTDVTQTLRSLDGKYLDTFGRGPYQGITRDHFVEIDLGDPVPMNTPLWLIAKGWLHPSDSTVNIAMAQGMHDRPRWLSLEVPDGRGGWRVAKSNLGFPAGRNKICLIDLTGVFPPGAAHRLRLRTNLEIYWDSIEWAQGMPTTPLKIQRLQPSTADLHYRGFSAVSQANASSPEIPSYQQIVSTAPQWRDLSGFYTRFGDVKELLSATDDRCVIMNAGDEMSLRFTAPVPPPAGWVRDYVIAGDGWIKDGDYNSTESRTVMPYPYHARKDYDSPPARIEDDWEYKHHAADWETYQTRYVDASAFRNALQTSWGIGARP